MNPEAGFDGLLCPPVAGIPSQNAVVFGLERGVPVAKHQGSELPFSLKSDALDRWFGKSKVVNQDGSPMVVYHGTTSDVEAFEPSKRAPDLGFHFGSLDQADPFARREGGNVMPVYLRIENPLRMPDSFGRSKTASVVMIHNLTQAGILTEKENSRARDMPRTKLMPYLISKIEAAGYDGIVYRNEVEGVGGDSYAAFHPEQIKSAIGNPLSARPIHESLSRSGTGPRRPRPSAA